MGDLDGRLRVVRRRVRQLRHRAGRGSSRAGRRVHSRLPAAPRGAHLRHRAAAEEDRRLQARSDAESPHRMTAEEIIAAIAPAVPGATYEALASADAAVTPTIVVPREHLVATCKALQAPGLEYVGFSDVTAVDFHPTRTPRFDLVYHLVSPHRRARVRLKVRIDADQSIQTLT